MKLIIKDIIKTENAILQRYGKLVFDELQTPNDILELSFLGITQVTSGFCNSLIQKLYINYPNINIIYSNVINDDWYKLFVDAKELGLDPVKRYKFNKIINSLFDGT